MLNAWMRLARDIRPWIVAVALACGGGIVPSCSGSDTAHDVGEDFSVEYGPQPCLRDDDCTGYPGGGLVCGPGGWCQPASADADADVDVRRDDAADDSWVGEYGPPTCYSDEDCAYMGAGWVCSPSGWCEWGPVPDADADSDVVEEDVSDDVDVEVGPDVLLDVVDADAEDDAEPDGPDSGSGIPDA